MANGQFSRFFKEINVNSIGVIYTLKIFFSATFFFLIFLHEKNSFVETSKNLVRYRSENNFL